MTTKTMLLSLAKEIALNLLLIAVVLMIVLWTINVFFDVKLIANKGSIVIGGIGAVLAFIGNAMVADAVTRYDASGLPQWKWGNKLQAAGFALAIIALLVE